MLQQKGFKILGSCGLKDFKGKKRTLVYPGAK
jgi:hypothetical protein